jgi:hypothetical protein
MPDIWAILEVLFLAGLATKVARPKMIDPARFSNTSEDPQESRRIYQSAGSGYQFNRLCMHLYLYDHQSPKRSACRFCLHSSDVNAQQRDFWLSRLPTFPPCIFLNRNFRLLLFCYVPISKLFPNHRPGIDNINVNKTALLPGAAVACSSCKSCQAACSGTPDTVSQQR